MAHPIATPEEMVDLERNKLETIIRAPNGSERRKVNIGEIQIPDLWHVAMHHLEIAQSVSTTERQEWHKAQAEMILETWHLAHDLITNIRAHNSGIDL